MRAVLGATEFGASAQPITDSGMMSPSMTSGGDVVLDVIGSGTFYADPTLL
jgi:hypothetical protein